MKSAQVPVNRQMDKENMMHKTMEYYLVIKKMNPVIFWEIVVSGGHQVE
jgi:hypothetical protein